MPLVLAAGCSDLPTPAEASARIADAAAPSRTEAAYALISGAVVQPVWTSHTPIPDSSWILVEVRGTISYSRNPYCYVVRGFCDAPPLPLEMGSPYGPLQEEAQARITTRFGSQPPPVHDGEGITLWSPIGDPRGNIGRRLFHNTFGPGQLWAMHQLRQTWAGSATSGVYWPVHEIAGGRVLDVKVVPTPLRVDGPSTVPPGEAGTWNAAVVGDFRLRSSNGVPAVQWEFFPGDTFAKHNDFGPRERLSLAQCSTLVCTYTPDRAGRMVAWTYVEGEPVRVASNIFRQDSARLELTCNKYTLERGDSLRCSAAAKPSGTLDSIRWEFADTAGNHITGPADVHSWEGFMVLGGRITVSARLNGGSVTTEDTVVRVARRRWPRMNVVAADSGNGRLPTFPTAYHELAVTQVPYPLQPPVVERISTGPNAAMWYIKNPITTVTANVFISDAFKPGSPFYQMQHAGTDPAGNPYCSKGQVHHVETGARQHEGLLPSPALMSHVEVYQRWFRTNAPQDSMESVIGRDTEFSASWTFTSKVMAVYVDKVQTPAHNDPNQKHTSDNPPGLVAFPQVPCALRF